MFIALFGLGKAAFVDLSQWLPCPPKSMEMDVMKHTILV